MYAGIYQNNGDIRNIRMRIYLIMSNRWRAKMKISARNMLKGKIKSVKPGVVNTEVMVELAGGGIITSIITKESAEGLSLAVGKDVYAVIKASNVMIATD